MLEQARKHFPFPIKAVRKINEYDGYDVYEAKRAPLTLDIWEGMKGLEGLEGLEELPDFDPENPPIHGVPILFLVKEDSITTVRGRECFKYAPPEDDYEEDPAP